MRFLKAISDIFLPRTCIVCGRKLFLHEEHICLHCLADIPMTHFWKADHNPMADRLNGQLTLSDCCVGERYSYACALFFYEDTSPYRSILHDIKYRGNISAGKCFGRMLGRKIASSGLFNDVDCIVPVPLHWRRKWKRGYNQAEVIASGIAAETGAILRTDLLRRTRSTSTQTRVEVEDKKANVKGAFEPTARAMAARPDSPMHILVVDDVFTTGSTVTESYHALRMAFPPPVRISVATLAFVGGA